MMWPMYLLSEKRALRMLKRPNPKSIMLTSAWMSSSGDSKSKLFAHMSVIFSISSRSSSVIHSNVYSQVSITSKDLSWSTPYLSFNRETASWLRLKRQSQLRTFHLLSFLDLSSRPHLSRSLQPAKVHANQLKSKSLSSISARRSRRLPTRLEWLEASKILLNNLSLLLRSRWLPTLPMHLQIGMTLILMMKGPCWT